jgi:hypothetical protein
MNVEVDNNYTANRKSLRVFENWQREVRMEEVGHTDPEEEDRLSLLVVAVSRSGSSSIKASKYNAPKPSVGGVTKAVNQRGNYTHIQQQSYFIF